MFKKTLGCLVLICCPLSLVGNSYGWDIPTPPSDCPGGCDRYLRTPNTYTPPSRDYEAERRAQEAAAAEAEAQRQRDAELEQQRIEADNNRRLEEIAKQKEFEKSRDAAASTLRGSTGSMSAGGSGLRGSSATADQDTTVLRGAGSFGSDVLKLKGSGSSGPPIRNGSPSDPGSQLKSTLYHGTAAQGGSTEGAHTQAGKGFDTLGENRGTQAVRPDKRDRSPSALAAKIPAEAWKKDPQIGQLYGYYKNLSAIKEETLTNIADIKQRQKSGKEDPAVLSAQLSSLNNQLKGTDKDRVKTENTIKKHVDNLGLSWNEGGTDSATAQTTGDKK